MGVHRLLTRSTGSAKDTARKPLRAITLRCVEERCRAAVSTKEAEAGSRSAILSTGMVLRAHPSEVPGLGSKLTMTVSA